MPESSAALAHALAGSSATVGYAELSALARALEHALMCSHAAGVADAVEPSLFNDASDEIRRLLHQFAAGFLPPAAPALMERLAVHERLPRAPLVEPEMADAVDAGDAVDLADMAEVASLPDLAEVEPIATAEIVETPLAFAAEPEPAAEIGRAHV